jgi:hypothetical protein
MVEETNARAATVRFMMLARVTIFVVPQKPVECEVAERQRNFV